MSINEQNTAKNKIETYKTKHYSEHESNIRPISNYTTHITIIIEQKYIIPNSVKNVTIYIYTYTNPMPNSVRFLDTWCKRKKNYNKIIRYMIESNIEYKNILNIININKLFFKFIKKNAQYILQMSNICFIKLNQDKNTNCYDIKKMLIFFKNTNTFYIDFVSFKILNDISILRNITFLKIDHKICSNNILNNVHTLVSRNCTQDLQYIKNIYEFNLILSVNSNKENNIKIKNANICTFAIICNSKFTVDISILTTIHKLSVLGSKSTKMPNLKYIDVAHIKLR